MGIPQFLGRVVATVALVSVVVALPTGSNSIRCGPAGVDLRDPPTFADATPDPSWKPVPTGWIFKPWYQVLTSNTQVAQLRNFQWDPTPVNSHDPNGAINDLSSFQVPNSDTVVTSYGVATPNTSYLNVYEYRGTGILENATSQYSWLGWGCDGFGKSYYVSYATAAPASGTPAGIDFMSTSEYGLDENTSNKVVEVLKQSKSQEIRKIAHTFVPNIQDGGRRGKPRIRECNDECKTNKDLIGIIG
ncbi:hypothetical protein PMIN06_002834 [Paraphaeosphaeria minitans]|uniref:Uncharacterized protein n=1 Tax=Paraphaeosphaeria minitans TaxID=565426 RepID=A0A9P6KNM6_9PLEO|nr:hypothetical protein PMIN01_09572 [Paraphaeosphaeria minitans]